MFLHGSCLRVRRVLSRVRALWDTAMSVCPVVSRFTRRTKYLLLLVLCVLVIAWITSISDGRWKTPELVTPELVTPPAQTLVEKTRQTTPIGMEVDMEKQDEVDEEHTSKELCPENSPLLREFYCETTFLHFIYLFFFNSGCRNFSLQCIQMKK